MKQNKFRKVTAEDSLRLFNELDEDEKKKLVAFQLNGSAEKMSKDLEKVPPEMLGEFLKAVGIYIGVWLEKLQKRQSS
jgi:hypothetical protein